MMLCYRAPNPHKYVYPCLINCLLRLASVNSQHHAQRVLSVRCAAEPQKPPDIAMAKTRVVMHEIVLPSMGDFMQICFGGQVLSWIDICAGLAAKAVLLLNQYEFQSDAGPTVFLCLDPLGWRSHNQMSRCILALMVRVPTPIQVARGPCVTASIDAVHFLAPLRVCTKNRWILSGQNITI